MAFIHDKYLLSAAAVILIVAAVCLFDLPNESESENVIAGIVSDVKTTENGNTFFITDTNGNVTKCFYSQTVKNGEAYSITGKFSEDGNILFVSRLAAA